MDRVVGVAARARLKQAISDYVAALVASAGPMTPAQWLGMPHPAYRALFERVFAGCCSSCVHQVQGAAAMQAAIPAASMAGGAQAMQQFVGTLQLPGAVAPCLLGPNIGCKRATWVLVEVATPANHTHHMLLLFDKRRDRQIRAFDPRYMPEPLHACFPPLRDGSLQRRVEGAFHHDEHPVGSLLCMLVMLCCMRFNYYNPKDVAHMLGDVLTQGTHVQRDQRMQRLVAWFHHTHTIPNLPANALAFWQRIMPMAAGAAAPCSAVCLLRPPHQVCKRAPCRVQATSFAGAFCWQHRYKVFNCSLAAPAPGDQRCGAPRMAC
ncbi:hypothetical protein COO60DRAFT_1646880 [Scenedesmus sp. NREL 46B-D3]|nr:hypothetical protein COO60DRAFT_1646880 [Scenedesmus sp. NREL 46B-D3]